MLPDAWAGKLVHWAVRLDAWAVRAVAWAGVTNKVPLLSQATGPMMHRIEKVSLKNRFISSFVVVLSYQYFLPILDVDALLRSVSRAAREVEDGLIGFTQHGRRDVRSVVESLFSDIFYNRREVAP